LFNFVLLLAVCACDDDKNEKGPILLAADPPSLPVGESITATITAEKPFFTEDVTAPMTSGGGLTIESLTVQDKRTALASIETSAETELGVHRFLLELGDNIGQLDISVVTETPGPGSVTAEGDVASAGARHALLSIIGNGTLFDSECTVSVEGADGFDVEAIDVMAENWIEVNFSISLEQEPTQATVVVIDGIIRYEVPFTIVSPQLFENEEQGQALTKGRVGTVQLAHSQATFNQGTGFPDIDESVEWGEPEVIDTNQAEVLVRVPFDFEGDSLEMVAFTYTEGGAFLQMLSTEVALDDPAWLAAIPSRLEETPGVQTVDLSAQGVDLTAIESLTLEADDLLVLSSWTASAPDSGSAELVVGSGVEARAYDLAAYDGHRDVIGTIVVPGSGYGADANEQTLTAGDHLFLSIVVHGDDLAEGETVLEGDDDLAVVALTYVDPGCVIAEISVDEPAYEGSHTMHLSDGSYEFDLYFAVVASGL